MASAAAATAAETHLTERERVFQSAPVRIQAHKERAQNSSSTIYASKRINSICPLPSVTSSVGSWFRSFQHYFFHSALNFQPFLAEEKSTYSSLVGQELHKFGENIFSVVLLLTAQGGKVRQKMVLKVVNVLTFKILGKV